MRVRHRSAAASAGSAATAPVLLDTRELVSAFPHTSGYPMYATNPSLLDVRRGLYVVRLTPMSLFSPVCIGGATRARLLIAS